jgi:hypothetical protein
MARIIDLLPAATIPTPGAPSVAVHGAGGTTTFSYKIVGVDAQGGVTAASSAGSTAVGTDGSQSGTDFNRLTWTDPANAVSIQVYRTAGGATQGLIATVAPGVQTLDDTGLAGAGSAPSARAQLGYPADVSALREKMVEISGTFVGTYQIQGSVGGSLWTDEGSALTSAGIATIDKAWPMLRVKQTAYTSGTPTIKVAGHEER